MKGVIYASTALPAHSGFSHLDRAVSALSDSIGEQPTPNVLWKLEYQQQTSDSLRTTVFDQGIISLPALPQSLALDDSVVDQVKSAWARITGDSEDSFMKFDTRDGMEDEESFV
jgi:Rab proteins geranylgeranyltransferase component A